MDRNHIDEKSYMLEEQLIYDKSSNPVNTRRRFNVYKTSLKNTFPQHDSEKTYLTTLLPSCFSIWET